MQEKGDGEKINHCNNKNLKWGVQTLPNKSPSVWSTATLTFHVKRSPRIRIRGPVMFTTKGLRAAALVRLMTSPSPLAACSFNSGVPLRIPSRNIGRIGAIPWRKLVKHEYKHKEYHSQETYRGMSEQHTRQREVLTTVPTVPKLRELQQSHCLRFPRPQEIKCYFHQKLN